MLAAAALALTAGALGYCLLVLAAVRSYLRQPRPSGGPHVPISVLRPLAGADRGLDENLRSYFRQKYPEFEILAAVRSADDPARAVFEQVAREFPGVPSRLIVTGEPSCPNAKVYSLARMLAVARHDLLVMADSDTRVAPDFLGRVAGEFADSRLGLSTCPYRAVPGPSFWSRLEALGMNTDFLAGLLAARLVEGVRFAVGPTIVARRQALEAIGGVEVLADYLAEDFVMGRKVAEAGWRVILSRNLVEHHIGSHQWKENFRHRLRWMRSTRRSRPLGYVGQVFTYPLPLVVLSLLAAPWAWPWAAVTVAARAVAAWSVARLVLADPLFRRSWWLLPVEEMLSFAFWVAGFCGNAITWRGREYVLERNGRIRPLD
ncbi:MAG: bacteriohopanetetrol glucosamine biosynthesis glycosyltransferase HpnI [Bryobacterales bacterium]|nr:bacteriohopanetetrol glucosamine biosynthesis glycosyltransferase HpnI [Bryobacteraceae bacterium]MDW8129716.1 bacteriohopanetetrol glucosamine biosynthesis glycosyltransferase HpnI [Bryobacterales bacterium]